MFFKRNKINFTKDELQLITNKINDYEKYVKAKYKELSSDTSNSFDVNEYRLYSDEFHKIENILEKLHNLENDI